jgi:predicted small integral membrane protein
VEGLSILGRLGGLVQSMYWTWPTAAFFMAVLAMLVAMTVLQLVWPTVERKGFLPMPTTRGERLFIGLLCAAWIHLGWLGLTEAALWGASALSLVWFALVMRFG